MVYLLGALQPATGRFGKNMNLRQPTGVIIRQNQLRPFEVDQWHLGLYAEVGGPVFGRCGATINFYFYMMFQTCEVIKITSKKNARNKSQLCQSKIWDGASVSHGRERTAAPELRHITGSGFWVTLLAQPYLKSQNTSLNRITSK